MWLKNAKFRLSGIDTPELRSTQKHKVTTEEKGRAIKARDYLRELILDKQILIKTLKKKNGKYGRYIIEVFLDGLNINDKLVQKGHAVYRTY